RTGNVAPLEMAQRAFALPRQQSLFLPAVLNPFVQETRLTRHEKIKFCLLGVLLVPLRSVFLAVVLMATWLVAAVITFRRPLNRDVEPMTGWRRLMCRTVMVFLGRVCFLGMGFCVVVKGRQVSGAKAPILAVAPHSSFFDAIACIVAGLPSIVSRSESLDAPIFGRILQCLQPVLVSRKDPDSRKNTILEIRRRAMSGGHWPQMLIFPEGTCTNRSCLITFKQGKEIPSHCIRLSARFLPPHIPTEEEKENATKFAHSVRAVMARSLGVPVTDHTFEDCRLMISAGELTLPMEAGLVEFTKISRKLNLKWDNVKKELENFATRASSCKGGRIRIEEFAGFLKLPISPALQELFALFDRDGDGTIDFREYVIGVTVLCRPANTEEVIHTAFKLFDIDEDNNITRDEFSSLLRSALGVCDLNVSKLFNAIDSDGSGHITYDEFRTFALTHPEYGKLFTTYIELQRYQGLQGEEPDFDSAFSQWGTSSPSDHQEDSNSHKKDA
uniref:EF-hand domain-containing protein n=1 Tax=Electrophorus electricus TaxID=8005 RepID=A0A4W4HCB9_ELEEL